MNFQYNPKHENNNLVFTNLSCFHQVWFAENLNYRTGYSYAYDECDHDSVFGRIYTYEDDPEHDTIYGRLYIWYSANTACPAGWRLPTVQDFSTLLEYVGAEQKGTVFGMLGPIDEYSSSGSLKEAGFQTSFAYDNM